MKKRIIIGAAVLVLLIVILQVFVFKTEKTQTGADWLQAQTEYIGDLSSFVDTVDSVTTLYITGTISQEDFLTHLEMFKKELIILKATRDNDLKNKPIKLGSHNYYTKAGTEGIGNTYTQLEELINYMSSDCSDVNKLTYAYIAYRQAIIKNICTFEVMYHIMFGTNE